MNLLGKIVVMVSCVAGGARCCAQESGYCRGACDASAAVALNDEFFAAASDEENLIRVYRFDESGSPVRTLDLGPFLDDKNPGRESDLEAAAAVGDQVYWVTSHTWGKGGRKDGSRRRFFATRRVGEGAAVCLEPIGKPYSRLVEDLLATPGVMQKELRQAADRSSAKGAGLNLEGLAAWRDGGLLLGFRSPVIGGRALLVPLLNPAAVVEQGERAHFGDVIRLDLGGRGVRDLFFDGRALYVIGGGEGKGVNSRLYQWLPGTAPPGWVKGLEFGSMNPEAIVMREHEGRRSLVIFSDDGNQLVGGVPGKDLLSPAHRTFRWVTWRLP